MSGVVALNNVDHGALRVAIRHGAAFGDAVNQLLLFPTEFEQAQREFPILLRRDEAGAFYAVALLGLDRDENLFLDADGWQSRYIPAVQRRGPFRSTAVSDESADDAAIYLDLSDARVGADDGEPLYLRHGGDAPYLRHIAGVLETMRRGHAMAPPFFAALSAAGLIQPVELDIALDDGESYIIPDVFTLAQNRLAALDDATLAALHRDGHLRAATFVASSLGNIERLIALKTGRERW